MVNVPIGAAFRDDFRWIHQLAHEPFTKTHIPKTTNNKIFFGWYSSSPEISRPHFVLKLMRKADTQALEGIFSCNYGDRSTVPVGIYYPSKKLVSPFPFTMNLCMSGYYIWCFISVLSMSARIEAVNRRNSSFKVICTTIGGQALTIDITGPNGAVTDVKSVDVANVTGMGNDSFSAEVKVFHGKDGDSYNCRASNGVSNSSDNTTLEGL